MKDYNLIPTSAEVWAVIKARHHAELRVFASYSDPEGEYFGHTRGTMETSYGFANADYPLMEAHTTWDIYPQTPYKRLNEKHEYWLCIPVKEED